MQLTPKPVTAQWRGAADPGSVLSILDYTGTIILRDGHYHWRVTVLPSRTLGLAVELGKGITENGLMAARVLVEDVIRDHHGEGGDA